MSDLHRSPRFRRYAAAVRQWANAHPDTRCWRCGRTQHEHAQAWTAGHTIDGDPLAAPWLSNAPHPTTGSWLRAECATCNYSAGAEHGNALRQRPGTTRVW